MKSDGDQNIQIVKPYFYFKEKRRSYFLFIFTEEKDLSKFKILQNWLQAKM